MDMAAAASAFSSPMVIKICTATPQNPAQKQHGSHGIRHHIGVIVHGKHMHGPQSHVFDCASSSVQEHPHAHSYEHTESAVRDSTRTNYQQQE